MIELVMAVLPIVALLILMVGLKMPAIKAMPVAWLAGAWIALFYWKVSLVSLGASAIKGVFIAVEIMLIVLGAIFLLEVMKQAGFISRIGELLRRVSHDKRVHVILIAWTFGAFLEGAAGFGTPAALAAPLLVGLGVGAFPAVIVSLIANSTPVSFGAVGTPILIGLGSGISPPPTTELLLQVTAYTAAIHAAIGLFIPLLISCVYARLGPDKSFRKGLELWKFALFAGACFAIPYLLIALFLGPEFPSLLGGLIGLLLLVLAAGQGWFLPAHSDKVQHKMIGVNALSAVFPYTIAAAFLMCTRIPVVREHLKSVSIEFSDILGTGISYTFSPLLSPGIILLLVAVLTLLVFHESKKQVANAATKTAAKGLYAFAALAFAVALVQLFLASGTNTSGLASMPVTAAKAVADATGSMFILVSPLIGMLGSFTSGSNTVSNLLFAAVQEEAALSLGLPVFLLLALQTVGGAVGNMIALHNIIAASATVNLRHEEGRVISFNAAPAAAYALLAGILGLLIYAAL